jgi:hypothetical protein
MTAIPPQPPLPPQQGAPTGQPTAPLPGGSSSPRIIATVIGVVGALVIVGTLGSAAVSTAAAATTERSESSVDVAGVTALEAEIGAGDLRIEFADTDQARLDVSTSWGAERWTLERDGDTLRVASPDRWWMGWSFGERSEAVLTLPDTLRNIDADLSLDAGELRVTDGDFAELDVDLGAGSVEVTGSADTVDATVTAGRADLELSDVREAELSVAAGEMDAVLTGAQPRSLSIDVSAGRLTATVPDGEYDITSEVSAGDFENGLGSSPGAGSTVEVTVSAGQAVLRAG